MSSNSSSQCSVDRVSEEHQDGDDDGTTNSEESVDPEVQETSQMLDYLKNEDVKIGNIGFNTGNDNVDKDFEAAVRKIIDETKIQMTFETIKSKIGVDGYEFILRATDQIETDIMKVINEKIRSVFEKTKRNERSFKSNSGNEFSDSDDLNENRVQCTLQSELQEWNVDSSDSDKKREETLRDQKAHGIQRKSTQKGDSVNCSHDNRKRSRKKYSALSSSCESSQDNAAEHDNDTENDGELGENQVPEPTNKEMSAAYRNIRLVMEESSSSLPLPRNSSEYFCAFCFSFDPNANHSCIELEESEKRASKELNSLFEDARVLDRKLFEKIIKLLRDEENRWKDQPSADHNINARKKDERKRRLLDVEVQRSVNTSRLQPRETFLGQGDIDAESRLSPKRHNLRPRTQRFANQVLLSGARRSKDTVSKPAKKRKKRVAKPRAKREPSAEPPCKTRGIEESAPETRRNLIKSAVAAGFRVSNKCYLSPSTKDESMWTLEDYMRQTYGDTYAALQNHKSAFLQDKSGKLVENIEEFSLMEIDGENHEKEVRHGKPNKSSSSHGLNLQNQEEFSQNLAERMSPGRMPSISELSGKVFEERELHGGELNDPHHPPHTSEEDSEEDYYFSPRQERSPSSSSEMEEPEYVYYDSEGDELVQYSETVEHPEVINIDYDDDNT